MCTYVGSWDCPDWQMITATRPTRWISQRIAIFSMALALLLLAGCVVSPVTEPQLPMPLPLPSPEVAEPPPVEPAVAVVLSADTFHYRAVADALGDGNWQRYVMLGDGRAVLAGLRDGGHRKGIAIGQQALELLRKTDLTVAYCQVFDADGQLGGGRGVAPLPEFGAQLDAWLVRQPELSQIGLITSDRFVDVAERLADAARGRAVVLRHVVVGSDRELLDYARKHQVRVLTYNRAIFELGADLLISADPAEVARQVMAVLNGEATGQEATLRRVLVESRDVTLAGAE